MKRFIATLITMIMVLTMIPAAAFAETEATVVSDKDALAQALEAGGNVKIGQDMVLEDTVTVAEGKTAVLDLNGHTVSMLKEADITSNYEMLLNKGNLTVRDSAGDGALVFEYTGAGLGKGKNAVNTITTNPGAVLVVQSGTIQNKTSVADQTGYVIDCRTNGNHGDASLTVNGGNILSAYNIGIRAFGNSTTCTNNITITDGNIVGGVQLHDSNVKKNLMKLNISGGKFTPAVEGGYSVYVYGNGNASGAEAVIEGGEFDGTVYFTAVNTTDVFSADVKGGLFNNDFWAYTWLDGVSTPVKVITGGTYKTFVDIFCTNHGFTDGACPVCGGSQVKEIADAADLTDALLYATGGEIFKLTADIDLGSDGIVTDGIDFTLDGDGHAITGTSRKTFEIKNTTEDELNVAFKNVTINNAYTGAGGRCIDTRNDKINLTLDGVTLKAEKTAANTQPLNLGGYDQEGINVTVKNSTIDAMDSGYAVINFVKANITIENSTLTGYTTLYCKMGSNGTVINVTESVLEGINTHTGESNAFSTIMIEDAQDITINVKDSTVLAESRGDQPQFVVCYSVFEGTEAPAGKVAFTGNTKVNVVSNGAAKTLVNKGHEDADVDVLFGLGVTVKGAKVADKYLSDDTAVNNGKVTCAEHSYDQGVCTVCGAVDYDNVITEKEKENDTLKEELEDTQKELESTQKELEITQSELTDMTKALMMTQTGVKGMSVKVSGTTVTAKWDAVENAAGYTYVLQKNGKTYKTGTTTKTSLKWTNVTRGCKYTMKVTPYINYNGVKFSGVAVSKSVTSSLSKVSFTVKKSGSYQKFTAADQNSTGFQIYISTDSKFKKNVKKVTVTTKEAGLSKKLKTTTYFKKGKNYVKVRAYTTVNGKTQYGAWSKVKTVKR